MTSEGKKLETSGVNFRSNRPFASCADFARNKMDYKKKQKKIEFSIRKPIHLKSGDLPLRLFSLSFFGKVKTINLKLAFEYP